MNSLRMSFWIVPASCSGFDALLLGGHHVQRQDRQHRTVHGHRHTHLVERDTVERLPHVENRVDRHTGHPDVTGHPWVVGVSHGGWPGRRRSTGPSGRLPGCAGRTRWTPRRWRNRVLTDRPRPGDVHRGVRATQEGRETRQRVQEVQAVIVAGVVGCLTGICSGSATPAARQRSAAGRSSPGRPPRQPRRPVRCCRSEVARSLVHPQSFKDAVQTGHDVHAHGDGAVDDAGAVSVSSS